MSVETFAVHLEPSPPISASCHILIVEDQQGPREALAAILRPYYRICTAETAAAALRIVQEQHVDLVIEDVGLPDRNGIDLLRDLLALRDMKVIVMSGAGTVQSANDALNLGAVAYLLKPFNVKELLDLVHQALQRRAA
jgi:DNA-binding NtrC family response regulator